jgi:hypothetical protein
MKLKFEITVSGTASPVVNDNDILRPFNAAEIAAGIAEEIRYRLESTARKNFKVEIRAL